MKKILITSLIVLLALSYTNAQELKWYADINKALEVAGKENKTLMLFFTGSDWCGWCKRLQREVFNTSDFEVWSKNVVLVELDFPRRTVLDEATRTQNYQLQKIFRVRGYPAVFFVNAEKMDDGRTNLKSLGRTGYVHGGAKKWIDVANSIVKKVI
ncbi:thioredoxin family protein [Tamlana sp. 2201CG12-4]|uniref:thioredoxin family protein n=1 Tax=Tamlana sp. 2201CG12-4 TaxID=3112582 RepID=UPI002DBFE643|nr:thioredoxin family protein [Tamlana sp. 2201CG12-4]MEC3907064.1 thioredoxin family protein [Tamlana sp. 2201CG12-4]